MKIVTACSQGLCRSVALADVLKLHFEPVDVIPIGLNSNSQGTIRMLQNWCDWFIIMDEALRKRVPDEFTIGPKLLVCNVGKDRWRTSRDRDLIDMVWQWARMYQQKLGIQEHNKRL